MKQESMEYAKKILLDVIEKSGGNIIFEHTKRSKWRKNLLNDKGVMYAAAKKGLSLSNQIPDKFLRDEKFLSLAVYGHQNLEYLFKIKSKFTKNKNFIKNAVSKDIGNFSFLKRVKSKFYKDRDITLSIIKNRGDAIVYADKKFINNKNLLMNALRLLKKQKSRIKKNFEYPIELTKSNYGAYKEDHPLKKYYNDEKFLKEAIYLDGDIYSGLSKKLRLLKLYAMVAVKHKYFNLQYVPWSHKNYREILIEAMKDKGRGPCQAIEYMDPKYKSDQEVIFAGIKAMSESTGQMLSGDEGRNFFWKYIDKKLKKNKSFIIKALRYGCIYLFDLEDLKDPEVRKVYDSLLSASSR